MQTAAAVQRTDGATVVAAIPFQCFKCGTSMSITPVDESDRYTLLAQPTIHQEWADDGPGCSMCQHSRGGYYPLRRVPRDGEDMTLAQYEDAIRTRRALTEPADLPDDCSEAQEDAWSKAWDAIDNADDEIRRLKTSLTSEYGYPDDLIYDLEDAIDRQLAAAVTR